MSAMREQLVATIRTHFANSMAAEIVIDAILPILAREVAAETERCIAQATDAIKGNLGCDSLVPDLIIDVEAAIRSQKP